MSILFFSVRKAVPYFYFNGKAGCPSRDFRHFSLQHGSLRMLESRFTHNLVVGVHDYTFTIVAHPKHRFREKIAGDSLRDVFSPKTRKSFLSCPLFRLSVFGFVGHGEFHFSPRRFYLLDFRIWIKDYPRRWKSTKKKSSFLQKRNLSSLCAC